MKASQIKAVIYFHLSLLLIGLVQACCTNSYRITTEGETWAYQIEDAYKNELDSIKGPFALEATFPTTVVAAVQGNSGFIGSAVATSCGEEFLNALKEGSFSLSIDQPILFQNDSIAAGEDLLSTTSLQENLQVNWGSFTVEFAEEFLQQAQFEDGYYTFTVKGTTTDDLDLESELTIYVEL